MFSLKESKEIIQDTFSEHGIGVLMSNDSMVPESQEAKRFDDSINRIYILVWRPPTDVGYSLTSSIGLS